MAEQFPKIDPELIKAIMKVFPSKDGTLPNYYGPGSDFIDDIQRNKVRSHLETEKNRISFRQGALDNLTLMFGQEPSLEKLKLRASRQQLLQRSTNRG